MVSKMRLPSRKPVVLLVEDNEGDAALAKMAFATAKVPTELHCVDTGFKALCFLRKEGSYSDAPTPDLIVLDIYLPTLDGKEILEVLRSDSQLSRLPVVVLTSSASPHDVEACYRAGCRAYMKKPVDFAELSERMEMLCSYWFQCAVTPGLADSDWPKKEFAF